MTAKIRLKKVGRKGQPSYRVVVLDGRKPRDAKVVSDLGHYDPKTNPPSFEIDNDTALQWLMDGAKATRAARSVLSKAGVMAAWDAVAHGGAEPGKAREVVEKVAEAAKLKQEKKAKARTATKPKAAPKPAKETEGKAKAEPETEQPETTEKPETKSVDNSEAAEQTAKTEEKEDTKPKKKPAAKPKAAAETSEAPAPPEEGESAEEAKKAADKGAEEA